MVYQSSANVALVAIGDELLNGRTFDTNSHFITEELVAFGINISTIVVVPDQEEAIKSAIVSAGQVGKLILTTGGLGPTSDDITRYCIADLAGVGLVEDQASLLKLQERARSKGRQLYDSGKRQAYFPEGARVVENPRGTANSFITKVELEGRDVSIFSLPGVPGEMKNLLRTEVIPFAKKIFSELKDPVSVNLRCFGFSESWIGSVIEGLGLLEDFNVAYRPKFPEVILTITALSEDMENQLDSVADEISKALGSGVVYSRDVGVNLEKVVLDLAKEKGVTIALAESCTGGLIASKIVGLEGASSVFKAGVVAYSNNFKTSSLGVAEETLEQKGAVSEEVAKEMATGLLRISGADIAISTTGIAGPGGGSEDKPVGTVFFGFAAKGEVSAVKKFFPYSRNRFREITSITGIDLLRRHLSGLPLTFDLK